MGADGYPKKWTPLSCSEESNLATLCVMVLVFGALLMTGDVPTGIVWT